MSILRIWWIEIRSGGTRERADVENRGADLSRRREPNQGPRREPNRGPRRNLGAFPDRVAGDEAIHARKVGGRNRALDRDRAVPSHRSPGAVLDPAVAGNRQADPSPGGEQDQIPGRSARVAADRAADRSRAPEDGAALDPDEDRGPGVAPNPAAASGPVTRRDAAEDPPPSLKSRERGHGPHHPDENRAAVPGLCPSPPIGEVVLGREQFPRIILVSKT